ncbi:MAG: hypothetical protein AAF456_04535 [Planctomycetota bacterium]
MNRDKQSNSLVFVGVLVLALVMVALGGFFFLGSSPSADAAQTAGTDFQQRMESLNPEAREFASNILELSETFGTIADEAARLDQSSDSSGAADIVSRINSATRMKNATDVFPSLTPEESTQLQCFTAHYEQQHSRMFREVYAASVRIGGREQHMIQTAIRQFSETQTQAMTGISSSYID